MFSLLLDIRDFHYSSLTYRAFKINLCTVKFSEIVYLIKNNHSKQFPGKHREAQLKLVTRLQFSKILTRINFASKLKTKPVSSTQNLDIVILK